LHVDGSDPPRRAPPRESKVLFGWDKTTYFKHRCQCVSRRYIASEFDVDLGSGQRADRAAVPVGVERAVGDAGAGPAVYNIVDDEPAPVREWLPVLAPTRFRPRRAIPTWPPEEAGTVGT
jgi:hypothetical protein